MKKLGGKRRKKSKRCLPQSEDNDFLWKRSGCDWEGHKEDSGAGNSLFLEIIEHIKEGIENIKKPPRKYKG